MTTPSSMTRLESTNEGLQENTKGLRESEKQTYNVD